MKNTEKKTKINSVCFKYVGTDEQFETFVKSVVKDYHREYENRKQYHCSAYVITNYLEFH